MENLIGSNTLKYFIQLTVLTWALLVTTKDSYSQIPKYLMPDHYILITIKV